MIIDQLLQRSHSHLPILQATFGLERESLRIHQPTQRVAQTPHPKTLGVVTIILISKRIIVNLN